MANGRSMDAGIHLAEPSRPARIGAAKVGALPANGPPGRGPAAVCGRGI